MADETTVTAAEPEDSRDWYEERGRHLFGECDPLRCAWCLRAAAVRKEGTCDSVQP